MLGQPDKSTEWAHAAKERKGEGEVSQLPVYLVVGLGGFVGASARFAIGRWALAKWGTGFPYGTFVINIAGCFLLGLFATLADRLGWNDYSRFAVAVGFLGAFTTFSTFEYESFRLIGEGHFMRAGANIVGSVVVGFLAVCAGVAIARFGMRGHA